MKLGFLSLLVLEVILFGAFTLLLLGDRKERFQAVHAFKENASQENKVALAYQEGIDAGSAEAARTVVLPILLANSAALIWVSTVTLVRKYRQKDNQ